MASDVDRQHHGMGQIATALTGGGFAMAADRSQSPAYQTLTPAARKVLAVIEGKVADGGGCVCRRTMRGNARLRRH